MDITQQDSAPVLLPQALLAAIVDMTAQRDLDALAFAVVRTVHVAQPDLTVCVYSLQGELGNLSARVVACSDPDRVGVYLTHLDEQPLLRQCIDRQEITEGQIEGRQKRVYPVIEAAQVIGLVSCEAENGTQCACEALETLVKVYANQHGLLDHQQRDGLTGLFNRAALDRWLKKALATGEAPGRRALDEGSLGCLAIIDIDHFKRVNDSLGHLYGDEVLLALADLMRESFRFNDILFRYGGEEFVVVLTDTDLAAALRVLERFRARVAGHDFKRIEQVTLTIGVVEIAARAQPDVLIDQADKSLYYGKKNGRNQVNAHAHLRDAQKLGEEIGEQRSIELF